MKNLLHKATNRSEGEVWTARRTILVAGYGSGTSCGNVLSGMTSRLIRRESVSTKIEIDFRKAQNHPIFFGNGWFWLVLDVGDRSQPTVVDRGMQKRQLRSGSGPAIWRGTTTGRPAARAASLGTAACYNTRYC